MIRAVIYDPQHSMALEMSPNSSPLSRQLPLNDGQALPDGCHLQARVFAPELEDN